MELQFETYDLRCLRPLTQETFRREQTGEARLPESLPDAASVVATWGQVLLRGKEWRSGGVTVTGGVQAFVLYAAEGSGELHCVDLWLPVQMKWEFPDPGRDGQICAWGCIQAIDARLSSARKILVRADVSVTARCWVRDTVAVPRPGEMPPDVQVRTDTYPVMLCREAGEHAFTMEEILPVPEMEKIVRYTITPKVTEHRVMGDKVVFRGELKVNMLGLSGGRLTVWEGEVPLSQFAELEQTYEEGAEAWLQWAVTSMEAEPAEGGCSLKCGLACQYVICQREMVTIPRDGYSIDRETQLHTVDMEIPCALQMCSHNLPVSGNMDWEGMEVIDATLSAGQGVYDREEGCYAVPVFCQTLSRDGEGRVRGDTCRWEEKLPLSAAEGVRPGLVPLVENFSCMPMGSGLGIEGEILLGEMTEHIWPISGVSGVTVGEMRKKDPNRPSLILCRCPGGDLWETAKSCHTTEKAIREANALPDTCPPGKMLIIPIA